MSYWNILQEMLKEGGKEGVKQGLKETGKQLIKDSVMSNVQDASGGDAQTLGIMELLGGLVRNTDVATKINNQNAQNQSQSQIVRNNNIAQQAFEAFIGKNPDQELGYGGYAGRTIGDVIRSGVGLETTQQRKTSGDKLSLFREFTEQLNPQVISGPMGGMNQQNNPIINPSAPGVITAPMRGGVAQPGMMGGQPQMTMRGIPPTELSPYYGTMGKQFYGQTPESQEYQRQAGKMADIPIDIQAQQAKDAAKEVGKSMSAIPQYQGFLREFEKSEKELTDKYPDIGKTGIGGKVTRGRAWINEKLDTLPDTSAFESRKQVRANAMARSIEGGRVTDQDRKIYADAMASALGNPTKENISLVVGATFDLYDKRFLEDGTEDPRVLQKLKQVTDRMAVSDSPTLQGIYNELVEIDPAFKYSPKIDIKNPKIKKALQEGYSEEEILQFLGDQ